MKYVLSAFFNNALLLVTTKNKHRETVSRRVSLDARLLNKILPPRYSFEVPQAISIPEKIRPANAHELTFSHNGQQNCFIKGCFGLKSLASQFCKVAAILFEGKNCV
ncbi:hypothetical protein A0J61_01395 [Choanephora cucurbitarum]|uniref:Uncharacterized protein n=1 Tax=Choanephora cucurbitarum TaxID=101091 RepID=A0A1C7NN36_9FUNG|nr:hypothetical protein A0J61_01395 [Choanephora cucurbitarum]